MTLRLEVRRLDDRLPLLDFGLLKRAQRLGHLLVVWENLVAEVSITRKTNSRTANRYRVEGNLQLHANVSPRSCYVGSTGKIRRLLPRWHLETMTEF